MRVKRIRNKGLSVGMDDFKAKPVTLQVLKELESSTELQQVRDTLDTVLVDPENEWCQAQYVATSRRRIVTKKTSK